MSIRPTDLPVNIPREVTGVHRVERDSEAQGFGRKQSPEQDSEKNGSHHDDAPVTVEVSDEYLTSASDADHHLDNNTTAETEGNETDLHLDIQA